MPRYQLASIRTENRADGLTWVLRYHATPSDGKRVERTIPLGLVKDIGPSSADASREVGRQKLLETINNCNPSKENRERLVNSARTIFKTN